MAALYLSADGRTAVSSGQRLAGVKSEAEPDALSWTGAFSSTLDSSLGLTRPALCLSLVEEFQESDHGFVRAAVFGRAVPRAGELVHVSIL